MYICICTSCRKIGTNCVFINFHSILKTDVWHFMVPLKSKFCFWLSNYFNFDGWVFWGITFFTPWIYDIFRCFPVFCLETTYPPSPSHFYFFLFLVPARVSNPMGPYLNPFSASIYKFFDHHDLETFLLFLSWFSKKKHTVLKSFTKKF